MEYSQLIQDLLNTIGIPATFLILFWINNYAATKASAERAKADDEFQGRQLQIFADTLNNVRADFSKAVEVFQGESRRYQEQIRQSIESGRRDYEYRAALKDSVEVGLVEQKNALAEHTAAINRMASTVSELKTVSLEKVTSLIGIKSRLDEIVGSVNLLKEGITKKDNDELKEARALLVRMETALDVLNTQIDRVAEITILQINEEQKTNGKHE